MRTVAVSGFFNPIHSGHISYLKEASMLGDKLIVILNTDAQVKLKGTVPFMNYAEREYILGAIKYVDKVIPAIDNDLSVKETLRLLNPDVFAKGGDRTIDNIPELEVCQELAIELAFDIGGKKTQSSRELIANAQKVG